MVMNRRRAICTLGAIFAGVAAARAADDAIVLRFDDLYGSYSPIGMTFSDKLKAAAGHRVRLRGFMAPPLKPDARFFVLSRQPMAVCPFCSSDADWPMDIVTIYLKGTLRPTDPNRPLVVDGRLEVGSWLDPDSGFVSQIRIVEATIDGV